jgi:D-glycero-alpha-D-manno-heptose-7-phosphate kinase
VVARAPVRICDLGGWTDTWFARSGAVLNIAVEPGVEVVASRIADPDVVVIDAADFGDRYEYRLGVGPGRHPLLEEAVAEAGGGGGVDLRIRSAVPPGAGAGTSAAVIVALIAAVDALSPGAVRSPMELARAAHRVETVRLERQSGVQDQLAAAHGGVSFITIDEYPEASVERLALSPPVADELGRRLLLVYLGRGHDSSAIHRHVISELEASPTEADARLEPLRAAAVAGRGALLAGDLAALGTAMLDSTDAQERLHPELVSDTARAVFSVARRHGALGWKVNGAGGEGGSVTVLCGDGDRHRLVEEIHAIGGGVTELPVTPAEAGARCATR